jgi:hypothetical protein
MSGSFGGLTIPCGCPITKSLQVAFTGSSPAPANGYIVKWRIDGSGDPYTQVYPNPTSSPVTITGVPACEDIEVVMQAQCANSEVSAPQTIVATAYPSTGCSTTINASHTHNGYYLYPDYLLDLQAASSSITLTYDVIDKPNRITVYDDNSNIVADSGWRGVAAYAGPWGTSLNTATTGVLPFTKASGKCFYRLVIESVTDASFQDTCQIAVACPITGPVTPVITLLSCSSGYGSYRIDAAASTSLKVKLTASGSLTNNSVSGYCARLEGSIASSTGPSDIEVSGVVTTTGGATIGSNNSLFVDVIIPSSGYAIINTSVFTVNSLAGSTTASLNIFEVNGSATNISQSVCVQNSTGVVSCDTPTLQNYYATKYACGSCTQVSGEGAVLVALPVATTAVLQDYYVPSSGSGEEGSFVYLLESLSSSGPGLILQNLHSSTCPGACALSNNT